MKPKQSFPNQTYTSIETAELERLRARVVELEALRKQFEDYVRRSEEDSESLRAQLAEARAVVVPEIADDELRKMILSAARRKGCIDFDPEDVSDGDLEILHEIRDDLSELFCAIPADRALGEGMVQISERELACMRAELEYRRAQSDEAPDSVLDRLWDAFDALRDNQGGTSA